MGRKVREEKGGAVVEAAVIMPAMLLVLAGLVVSFLLLCQKALLVKAASRASQQGAQVWTDSRKNIEDGWVNPDYPRDSLYYALLEDCIASGKKFHERVEAWEDLSRIRGKFPASLEQDLVGRKIFKIREAVYSVLEEGGLLRTGPLELSIEYKNNLVNRELKVRVTQEIEIPVKGIRALFGGRNSLSLSGEAVSQVVDPPEYIRNLDIVREYSAGISHRFGLTGILSDLKNKLAGQSGVGE